MLRNRVLVLGGNGFIGKNLCEYFREKNWEVTSFDLLPSPNPAAGISYIEGNFFDDKQLEAAINNQDLIIHAISTVNPSNSSVKFMQGYSGDLVQTAKLCAMLIGTGTRMIYLSSGGTVYGNQSRQPIPETASTIPINHYGCLKICIENIIRTFNIQHRTNFIIARVANPFGPGQDYKKGVGFIDAAVKRALMGDPIEIWGDGEIIRDYIYITDVCRMIFTLAAYRGSKTTFNISSGVGISQNQVISFLREHGYDVNVVYKEARNVDAKKIILDNSEIMTLFNGEILSFEQGLKQYCSYLEQQ